MTAKQTTRNRHESLPTTPRRHMNRASGAKGTHRRQRYSQNPHIFVERSGLLRITSSAVSSGGCASGWHRRKGSGMRTDDKSQRWRWHRRPGAANATTSRVQTTSFLIGITLIYATGAGINAAAGTRFALRLVFGCNHSYRNVSIQFRVVIFHQYHLLPGVGNLRACFLPFRQPFRMLHLRYRTPTPRYP